MAENAEWRLQRLETQCGKHHTDLYEGRGKEDPSFNERLSLVESLAQSTNNTLKWIARLLVATFLAVVANMIFKGTH